MVHISSKLSASQTHFIAFNFCPAPREAYWRMILTLKAAEIYLSLIVVRNRFNKMLEYNLATEEVFNVAVYLYRYVINNSKSYRSLPT